MKGTLTKIVGAGLATMLVSVMVFSSVLAQSNTTTTPFAVDGVTRALAPGDVHWYAFPYAGDESNVSVWLPEGTGFGITFSVWTPDQVQRLPGDIEPIGRGTFDEFGPGVQSWLGSFNIGGFYFVRVENTSVDTGSYVLRVAGGTLRLP